MTKKATIHKQNSVIRGSDDYSVHAKRAMNAIYWAIQKHNLFDVNHFDMKYSTLRELMCLQNDEDYVNRINDSIKELEKTIELNNWVDPWGRKVHRKTMRIVNETTVYKENKNKIIRIEMNNTMRELMKQKDNFTELDLVQYANKFRTKYAMKLYEYLKSFESYYYLNVTDKFMRELLNVQEIKKYQYFSTLDQLVERQMKEITSKSDLDQVTYKAIKATKTFRFLINKKSKKNADQQEAKATLDNLIKRF